MSSSDNSQYRSAHEEEPRDASTEASYKLTTGLPGTNSSNGQLVAPTEPHHSNHTGHSPNSLSPSTKPQSDPIETNHTTSAADFALNSPNHETTPSPKEHTASAISASANLEHLAEAQEQSSKLNLSVETISSSLKDNASRTPSPASRLNKDLEDLRQIQDDIPVKFDDPPRFPERADFPPSLSMKILDYDPDVRVEHCIILLHDYANTEAALQSLALRLFKRYAETAFILLRGPRAISFGNSGYYWADSEAESDGSFMNTTRLILLDIVKDGLITRCHFHPRNIVILGHCQGGMAALAATASWNNIEFGGVVSIGGPMPAYVRSPSVKVKTSALVLGGGLGNVTATALQQIEESFAFADSEIQPGGHDTIPESPNDIRPLLEFFAHRLRREEWTKQAVICFDGGGIRGYASLLILQALMNKIGEEEKSIDATESSFAPCSYKPTMTKPNSTGTGSPQSLHSDISDLPDAGIVVATPSNGLPNSELFLPCHYFTYVAGTSTGGLIGIMLSRFRMTVDDCIKEYKTLSDDIFGHPRPLAKGAILWHKFDHKCLRAAIQNVTKRHGEENEFGEVDFAMDEDLCRSIVVAIADKPGVDVPYLFRTYHTPKEVPLDRTKSVGRQRTLRNYGGSAKLPVWQVARATSAAPTYFPPIKIPKSDGVVEFRDGGFGWNNPSDETYYDVIYKHGSSDEAMGPFISIGTGITPLESLGNKKGNVKKAITTIKTVIKLPARTAKAHTTMLRLSAGEKFPYYRFDGGKRLGEIPLDEWKSHRSTWFTGRNAERGWKTLEKMDERTAAYLQRPDVQQALTESAKVLVQRRRLRTRDASEWDRYASYSYYECDWKGCQDSHIKKAHDFKEHLRSAHWIRTVDQVMDKKLLECRRVQWLYRSKNAPSTLPNSKKGKARA